MIPWEDLIYLPGVGGLIRLLGYFTLFAAIISLPSKKHIRALNAFHYLVIFFIIWNLAAVLWSIDYDLSSMSAFRYLRLAGLSWLIYEFAGQEKEVIWLIRSYMFGCVLVMSQILNIYFTKGYLAAPEMEGRITALNMNENDIALILLLGMGLVYFLLVVKEETAKIWKIIYSVFLPFAAVTMFMTGSRAGLISLLIGGAYLIVLQRKMTIGKRILLLMGLASIFIISLNILPDSVFQRFITTDREFLQGTWTGRLKIYEAGIEAFLNNPLLGVGGGNFEKAVESSIGIKSSHNAYLGVLVESGMVGFIAFISMFVYIIIIISCSSKRKTDIWMATMVMLMVGIFSLGWEYRKPLWLFFGLIINFSTRKSNFYEV
jgi:O-antigen ligase